MSKNFILWETNTSHTEHNTNNPDFDGFARLHAQNKPYTESDLQDYLQRSIEADQNNNRNDAIALYTEFINNMAAITETLSQGPRGEENDELDEN